MFICYQGRSKDLAGAGGQEEYFFQISKFACHELVTCALRMVAMRFARARVRGHVPPNFFLMGQFVAFWCIFESDFVFNPNLRGMTISSLFTNFTKSTTVQ